MKLFLLRPYSGQRVELGEVQSFEEASTLVKNLDAAFVEWELKGFPPDPQPLALASWEGSDVFLEDGDRTYMTTFYGWQEYHQQEKP